MESERLKELERRVSELEAASFNDNTLVCGYTVEQWDYIRNNDYFIQVFMNGEWLEPTTLFGYRDDRLNDCRFIDYNGHKSMECRLFKRPGIAIPWFGWSIPLAGNTIVIVKLRDGRIMHGTAGICDWTETKSDSSIIEYVYLK